MVVKENEKDEGFIVDKEDYSITRSQGMHREIFKMAGLEIIDVMKQTDFPENLIDVKLYVLK